MHHWEEDVHHAVEGVGAALAWCVNTVASLAIGAVWGAVVVAVMHVLPWPQEGRRRALSVGGFGPFARVRA